MWRTDKTWVFVWLPLTWIRNQLQTLVEERNKLYDFFKVEKKYIVESKCQSTFWEISVPVWAEIKILSIKKSEWTNSWEIMFLFNSEDIVISTWDFLKKLFPEKAKKIGQIRLAIEKIKKEYTKYKDGGLDMVTQRNLEKIKQTVCTLL